MSMYRGQNLGNRKQLIQRCLEILEKGDEEKIYEILPHLRIVRSPTFLSPLLRLLKSGSANQAEFAALALGSLGDPAAIDPLCELFKKLVPGKDKGEKESLQAHIIQALGEIGDDAAVGPLRRIYQMKAGSEELVNRRKTWVLEAIGCLAQQGCVTAVKELIGLMREEKGELRAQVITELGVAYWHRPNELPETVLHEMVSLTEDRTGEVKRAARSALSALARLGCNAAQAYQ